MGLNISSLLAHPLTGTVVQILFNWVASLPNNRDKALGEQILLRTLQELGYNEEHLKRIMPEQEAFIDKINEMEKLIEMERRLSSKYRTAYNAVKREMNKQLQSNEKIENYFKDNPRTAVKIPEECEAESIKAAKKNNVDRENYYNFAFVGHTNSGKSALINSILGLNTTDHGAAHVTVHETTHEITYYCHDRMQNVRFYDIPGAGSMTHGTERYYEEKALCGFDCLVILTQQALMKEEIEFARAASEFDQNVVFVRSRCDLDFHMKDESGNILSSAPTPEDVKDHIEELRYRFNRELETHAQELNILECFFVSAKSMRAIIRGVPADMVFEETKFLEYLFHQSKNSRRVF